MIYGILADIVVVVHFLWIVFLVAGVYWGRKYLSVMLVHGAAIGFSIVSQIFSWYCPLTLLEVWLRDHQNQAAGYAGSFIAHYAEKLVYLRVSRHLIFVMTIAWAFITIWLYVKSFSRGCRFRTVNRTC